jgi:hypothetical protein
MTYFSGAAAAAAAWPSERASVCRALCAVRSAPSELGV